MRRAALALVLAACGSTPPAPGAPGAPDAALGDAAVDATVVVDATRCGTRADRRGETSRTIEAGGLTRTYHVYLPEGADPATPLPLVFVHHGYSMSGQLMIGVTRYEQLADEEGVAVVFPDGQGGPLSLDAPWNVGDDVCRSYEGITPNASGDDFAMLDAIRADVETDQCIDARHVYVTGFSMGGYFANQAGCMRSDVRAVAPHSGGTHDLTGCTGGIKPVILFHGTADPVIPTSCGRDAAAAWAAHNGCAATTTSRDVDGGTCELYDGCPVGGQVELCTFTLMGHCWAGGPLSSGIYACPPYADATRLEWEFFKAYAW